MRRARIRKRTPTNARLAMKPMTGAQRSYLTTLCQEAGEKFDEKLEGRGVEAH